MSLKCTFLDCETKLSLFLTPDIRFDKTTFNITVQLKSKIRDNGEKYLVDSTSQRLHI